MCARTDIGERRRRRITENKKLQCWRKESERNKFENNNNVHVIEVKNGEQQKFNANRETE